MFWLGEINSFVQALSLSRRARLHDGLDDAKYVGVNQEFLGDEETKTKACSEGREEFLSCLFTILCRLQSDGEEGKKEVLLPLV